MDDPKRLDLTQLLRAAGQGDSVAGEAAVRLVYDDLKRTAQHLMRSDRSCTWQPTALLNEAYLRLLRQDALSQVPDRAYFFAAAARAMRQILVDEARRRNSLKRGGDYKRQPFEEILDRYESNNLDLVALDEALSKLGTLSPRQAKVVQLRWFAELTVNEVANLLEVSISTVEQEWRSARAYLNQQLSNDHS